MTIIFQQAITYRLNFWSPTVIEMEKIKLEPSYTDYTTVLCMNLAGNLSKQPWMWLTCSNKKHLCVLALDYQR